jgi:D-alanyl-D-alanine carboxypeptidase
MTCAILSSAVTVSPSFARFRFSAWKGFSTAFALSMAFVPAVSAGQGQASTLSDLQSNLTAHISQPRFAAAMWGVKVVSRDTGKVLFEHNSQKLFSPASNSKLYTVALALDRLGADYRIKTSLYGKQRLKHIKVYYDGNIFIGFKNDILPNYADISNGIFNILRNIVIAKEQNLQREIDCFIQQFVHTILQFDAAFF